MNWRDIREAPKNGRPIFGMMQFGQCHVLRYWTAEQIAEDEGSGQPEDYEAGWYQWDDPGSDWLPSWWMPVRELPAEVRANLDIPDYA